MSNMPPFQPGRLITLRTPDERYWVRLLAFIGRRPAPVVTRDYIVTQTAGGGWELTEVEVGPG